MKKCFAILSLFICLACAAADKPKPVISKQDRKTAEKEFKNALDLQREGKPEDALLAVTRAAQLAPDNMEFITMSEMLRQQIVGEHVEQGNRLAAAGDTSGAMQRFRTALGMDPQNAYVAQRLHDVAPPDEDPEHRHVLELLASVDQINLQPSPGKKNFHMQGDTRQLYNQIGTAFGIFMQFDQNMNSRILRFDLDNVDFYTVMAMAGKMTKTFWAPVTSHEAMVASDTLETRKQYERMALRTFYVGNVSAQTDLNDLVNVMRNIFDMKLVSIQPGKNTITVRAPREQVEAAASLLDNLMDAKPELMIDVKEYEIDTDNLRNIGLNMPTSFQIFSIPSEIRKVLGPAAQPVIDELNRTGTIDPSKIPTSSLSNLAGSPLLAPFLFFGKGLGLTGFTVPSISGKLNMNSSIATSLEHMTLRAIDGEAATFRVGTRFPVVNSTFSNVAFSTRGQISVGNTPQFTYEDLGITLKTTPHYHSNGDITLILELQIQGLGTLQINSIPDITSRSYKGTITIQDGEPSLIMGTVSEQELRSTQGLPILSQLPGLKTLASTNSKDRIHNELLIVITPHVVRKPFHDKGSSVFWTVTP
ncbi:MAG: type II and III secretion system protein [Acidobacteriia bacterium]|nr:type II and III secretion system protein [Terriglobia bacterium]